MTRNLKTERAVVGWVLLAGQLVGLFAAGLNLMQGQVGEAAVMFGLAAMLVGLPSMLEAVREPPPPPPDPLAWQHLLGRRVWLNIKGSDGVVLALHPERPELVLVKFDNPLWGGTAGGGYVAAAHLSELSEETPGCG